MTRRDIGCCPEHGRRPVRWIEGAYRCDECGEACDVTPGAGEVVRPDPTWDAQCAAFEAFEDAHADEMTALIAADPNERAPAASDGPHYCVSCGCDVWYPGLCGECGCEDDGDLY